MDFGQICGNSEKTAYAECIDHYSEVREERAAGHRRTSQAHPPLDFQGADIGESPWVESRILALVRPFVGL